MCPPWCFPLPFCASGTSEVLWSVATALDWQREVGGAQGVKTQCELLFSSHAPEVPHWDTLPRACLRLHVARDWVED